MNQYKSICGDKKQTINVNRIIVTYQSTYITFGEAQTPNVSRIKIIATHHWE